jgi:hypothetical protein
MKIGKPITTVPRTGGNPRDWGKYRNIYLALDKLKDGVWLPVQFNTAREAYNFRVAVETHRTRSMEAKQRESTVYVRGRAAKKSKGVTNGRQT